MRTLPSVIPSFFAIASACLVLVGPAHAVDWFVDASVTTPGGGTAWGDTFAFKYLRDALQNPLLNPNDVIKVRGATGVGLTYVTDRSAADQDGSCTPGPCNPAISFVIDKQIRIEGQYTGASTTERNPSYRTILSGAISATESSYSVVRFIGTLGSQTVLDGLEIRDGVADGGLVNPEYGNGAGVHIGTSAPDIRFCRIIGNRAVPNLPVIADQGPQDGLGGGLYARNGATLTLRACEIVESVGL